MKVFLTRNCKDRGDPMPLHSFDCDCDCDCACPLDGMPLVLPLPVAYYLELTPFCNNRCPACGNAVSHNGFQAPVMDVYQWNSIIEHLTSHANHFKLTGGEPTLHPHFTKIIRVIDKWGIHFTLFSNARWANPGSLLQTLENTVTCDGLLISFWP